MVRIDEDGVTGRCLRAASATSLTEDDIIRITFVSTDVDEECERVRSVVG
jgi:hypothetical protein